MHWESKIQLAFPERELNPYRSLKWDTVDEWVISDQAENLLLGPFRRHPFVL